VLLYCYEAGRVAKQHWVLLRPELRQHKVRRLSGYWVDYFAHGPGKDLAW
jgi:hypothetical protein